MLTSLAQNTEQLIGYMSMPQVDRCLINFINPNLENGPWIAGGAVWRWYIDQSLNGYTDVDVFFRNKEQFEALSDKLSIASDTRDRMPLFFTSKNAKTYGWKGYRIQLICRSYYDNVKELLDHFDIIACKIATDGERYFASSPDTITHIEQKILDMDEPLQPGSIKRFFKYWIYGFRPQAQLVRRLQLATDLERNFVNSNDYDHI